jgi:hypothetical protein
MSAMSAAADGIELRPATEADLRAFAGEAEMPTVKAIAGVRACDGAVLGIGGLRYAGEGKQRRLVLFLDLKPEGRKYRKAIVRGLRRVLEMAQGLPIIAVCDPSEPGAPALLRHIGLTPIAASEEGMVYVRV